MAVVGYLEGTFLENSPCKNIKYMMSKWQFPVAVYGKIMSPEELDRPPVTNILCEVGKSAHLQQLKSGEKYKLQTTLGVSKANESDGKYYPASLSINIVKVL